MVQIGPNDHFGQNDLIPNWILAFARPKWTGPFWPEAYHDTHWKCIYYFLPRGGHTFAKVLR